MVKYVNDLPRVKVKKEGCCDGMIGRLLTPEEHSVFVYFEGKHCPSGHTGIEIPATDKNTTIEELRDEHRA